MALLCGCTTSHIAETRELLGSYVVTVDPDGPEHARWVIEHVPGSDDTGLPKAATESVLLRVSLNGPGVWDADTRRMHADVRITNVGAPDMDEPIMVVQTVSRPPECVVFELNHTGGTHAAATYHYADITAPGEREVNGASARRPMSIYFPCSGGFSFQVDVFAAVRGGNRRIFPDRDDDGYNIEPGEHAGDDCDDNDPLVYPGGPIPCVCGLSCTSCGSGCCNDACLGSNNCSRTCPTDCTCNVTAQPGGRASLSCQPGSTCSLDCSTVDNDACSLGCNSATCNAYCEYMSKTCSSTCTNGADCTQQCYQVDARCELRDCSNGSWCTMQCEATSGDCRVFNGCRSGATCDVTCHDAGANCNVDVCRDGSNCNVACTGSVAGDCTLSRCQGGSACNVSCDGQVEGTCGIDECTGASSCTVSCRDTNAGSCGMSCDGSSQCVLDCGDYTGSSCSLQCAGGPRVQCGTSNVWVCPGTPCP